MKKLLLSLLSVAAVSFAASAVEPSVVEFKQNSTDYGKVNAYNSKFETTDGMFVFSAFNNNNLGWDFIAAGWKTDETKPSFATLKESPAAITTIVATVGSRYTKDQITEATLYVADNADFTDAATKDILANLPSAANSDMTIEVAGAAAGSYVKVEFIVPKQSTNGYAISFTKVAINYAEAGEADLQPAGLAWSETAVTVTDDKIAEFVAPTLTNPNNLTVTYSSSDENVAEVSETGVVTLTGDTGTATIKAAFAGDDTYRAGEATYTITVKAAPKTVASVAETIALPTKTEVIVGYELTVGWVNNSNIFVCDAAGKFIQIYGQNSYKVGDKIPAGWNATYEYYNEVTPELMPIGTLPAGTEGTFTPNEVAAADITTALVNSVVLVKNVEFAEATPAEKSNFTGKVGETELSFRNNYALASVEAGTYDVTVVVTIFDDAPSLYVTNYAPVQSSGIEDIEVEAGEAVYYNLQGVEVANPENGIYIVRRGNKVTKEVIR